MDITSAEVLNQDAVLAIRFDAVDLTENNLASLEIKACQWRYGGGVFPSRRLESN